MNVDPETHDDELEDELELTDAELTALALAANPDMVLGDDAVPFNAAATDGLLPDWYMPAAQAGGRSSKRTAVMALVVISLLALNAAGLCVTYGEVVVAW